MGASQQILSSVSGSAPKQALFTSVDGLEVSWVVPVGVTTICAVAIGAGEGSPSSSSGGSGGSGADLVYSNNIPVTAGETLTIRAAIGISGAGTTQSSYIKRSTTILLCAKGGDASDNTSQINAGTGAIGVGGLKSAGGSAAEEGGGGGGAGGYGGDGGSGGTGPTAGNLGGGGGGLRATVMGSRGGDGGGTCPHGEGGSGSPGYDVDESTWHGGTGSPRDGSPICGWGAGGAASGAYGAGTGGQGCVRIIWGSGRSFPSTRTLDE